jgi:mono/diheme cytochrome c family protein
MRVRRIVAVLLAVCAMGTGVGVAGAAEAEALEPSRERGRALFATAAGCGCHTPANGPVGAGGREIETPFGTFYSTNITPHEETGIGRWTDEEIDAAIRRGVVRDRGVEAPVMPYYRYAGLSDDDVADLIAYLRSLPPVRRENRPHAVRMPLARVAFWGWRLLYGRSGGALATTPRGPVARGRYLVDHLAICGDCHTPRNTFGAPVASMYLAGAAHGPSGEPVPNITPDATTGIGEWVAADIVMLLELGLKPSLDNVQGLMAEVIEGHGGGPGYAQMPAEDREAVAAYLKTIPAVANDIGAE